MNECTEGVDASVELHVCTQYCSDSSYTKYTKLSTIPQPQQLATLTHDAYMTFHCIQKITTKIIHSSYSMTIMQ